MNYRYEMTFSDLEELLSNPAGIAIAGMGLLVAFVVLACFVVMYVFQSIGLYTIAKRRGIANPGLAWVPVAYSWILGSVSDQYQYVVRGKVCNRRKILLGLAIAGFFLGQSGVLFLANYTTVLDAFDWDAFYFGVVWADLPLLHWRDWWRQPWRFTNISACTMCTSPAIPRTVWSFWCYLWCFPF